MTDDELREQRASKIKPGIPYKLATYQLSDASEIPDIVREAEADGWIPVSKSDSLLQVFTKPSEARAG